MLLSDIEREVSQFFIALRYHFCRLPAAMMPHFPQQRQVELAQEMMSKIHQILRLTAAWHPDVSESNSGGSAA